MKTKLSNLLAGLAAFAALLAPGQALAGKLSSQKIKPKMHYKITECKAPDAPRIKADTAEEYETVAAAFKTYLAAQQTYADCVEQEARRDLRTLREVIFTGGQEAIAEAQREIDARKARLDALRQRLQNESQ